jgi:hypothetical protein
MIMEPRGLKLKPTRRSGLVDCLIKYVCGDMPVRVIGVQHRAAGVGASAWQSQSVGEHVVSAAGVLQRLLAAGVGTRPVIFIAETVGSLLVQQMLLLPCSSQSREREVAEDAVAICEATLAIVDFASPEVGLSESFRDAEQKLLCSLTGNGQTGQLHSKVPYLAYLQDGFSRACATEHCLEGLVQVHVRNGALQQ